MKFGVGLFGMQTHPDLPYTHRDLYRNTLKQVKLAEEVNFESVWLSEHHFLEDGYCPSLSVTAAAMAAVTSRIRIGTAGIILPLHNPLRVAEDAAVVDNISNGRFNLGVVLGYRKEEFEGFGIPINHRPSLMDEGIEVIIKSWTEEKFSYNGKRYQYQDINVTPKPVQKPYIPIYIGAFEEPAIRRAGRFGIPLLIGPGRTMDMIKDTLGFYNDEARKAGKNPESVEHILLRETFIANNEEKAREGGNKYIIWNNENNYGSEIRQRIRQELAGPLERGDDIMMLAHCVGSVFAYDLFSEMSHVSGENSPKLHTLVTLGSPLADNYVRSKLGNSVAANSTMDYPNILINWFNVAAEDDFICHDETIANDFSDMLKNHVISQIEDYKIYNLAVRFGRSNPHSALG